MSRCSDAHRTTRLTRISRCGHHGSTARGFWHVHTASHTRSRHGFHAHRSDDRGGHRRHPGLGGPARLQRLRAPRRDAEAFTNLAQFRIRLEQYYQDNRRYAPAADATTCGSAAAAALTAAELGGETKYFDYTCEPSDSGQAYLLTATGKGIATGFAYTLNERGAKATTEFKGEAAAGVSCWASKSTSDCS